MDTGELVGWGDPPPPTEPGVRAVMAMGSASDEAKIHVLRAGQSLFCGQASRELQNAMKASKGFHSQWECFKKHL